MNQIECTFKLAYTSNTFSKVVDVNMSPYDLKNYILTNVNQSMELTDFDIIIAGTTLGERNPPIDCNNRNINILTLSRDIICNNHIAFYIKPISSNIPLVN